MNPSPIDLVYAYIVDHPGAELEGISKGLDLTSTIVSSILTDLKIHNKIGSVGSKYYDVENHSDVIPNLSDVYRVVRNHPESGVTLQSVLQETGFPERVVSSELQFLKRAKLIYSVDGKFYPTFRPEAISKKPLLERVDELTVAELKALVKLFIQSTTWAVESIESANTLLQTRQLIRKTKDPDPDSISNFLKYDGGHEVFKSDGTVDLQF